MSNPFQNPGLQGNPHFTDVTCLTDPAEQQISATLALAYEQRKRREPYKLRRECKVAHGQPHRFVCRSVADLPRRPPHPHRHHKKAGTLMDKKRQQPDGIWGSVKVKGVRRRVAACWINGELTRMAQHIDPVGGILTCTWEEERTFTTKDAPTHGERG